MEINVKDLKERMISLLDTAEIMEKELLEKRKNLEGTKTAIQSSQKQEDVAGDLESLQKENFFFGFLMQDFEKILSSIKELHTVCGILGADLELPPEKTKVVETITKAQSNIFGVKNGQLVTLDNSILELVSQGVKTDKESLKELFNMIVKSKLG